MIAPLIAPVALALAPVPAAHIDVARHAAQAMEAAPARPVTDAPPAIALPTLETPPQPVPAPPAEPVPAPAPPSVAPVAKAKRAHVKGDPLEGFNRTMFGIHEAVDGAVFRPVAMGYKHVVPRPARSGFRNVLRNLTEPFVFVNFILQGKPGKAGETLARFAINSTVGVAGLFDVAKGKDIRLPYRKNGFGTTLAIYGIGPGPYIFLPFMGPSTLRDALGSTTDDALLPVAVGKPFNTMEDQLATGIIGGLDLRAESDPELRALFADAIDRYATLRSVYLQNRAAEIEEIRGRRRTKAQPALPELDDPLSDPGAGEAAAPSPPTQSDAPELQDPLADPAADALAPESNRTPQNQAPQ